MENNLNYCDFVRTQDEAKRKTDQQRKREYESERREAMRTTATEYLNRSRHEN